MEVTMTPGWQEDVYLATDDLFASDLGPQISVAAKTYCPKRTGDLAASIEFHLTGHALIIAAHEPYAAYVELGTRPHEILPRNAQALRWYDSGGSPVFATRVHHPGTKPEPYLRPALYTVRGE